MARKINIKQFIPLIMVFSIIMLILSGCSVKSNMTNKELTKEFTKTTQAVLIARGTVAAQVGQKKVKSGLVKYSKKDAKQISAQKKVIDDSLNKVKRNSSGIAKYPSALMDYQVSASKYVSLIQSHGSIKQVKADFHDLVKKGQKLNIQYQGMKSNKYLNIAIFADETSENKVDSAASKISEATKKESKKAKQEDAKKKKKDSGAVHFKKKIAPIEIGIGWIIWFAFIGTIIIVLVFLQPNKSADAMNALTESGGSNLFNRPKPRGYDLFLIRVTQISIVLLIASLIVYNSIR